MANKNNNGIRTYRCWLMSDARRAVIEHAQRQAEHERRRRLREALQASPRNYQRLRTGGKQAMAEPPVETAADDRAADRKSRPTPVD